MYGPMLTALANVIEKIHRNSAKNDARELSGLVDLVRAPPPQDLKLRQ